MYAYPKITAELIRLMRVHGMSDAKIARELGIKRALVIEIAGDSGTRKTRIQVGFFDWPEEKKKGFERDYLAGIREQIMAQKYGVSQPTVGRYAVMIGLQKRLHRKTNQEKQIDICKQINISKQIDTRQAERKIERRTERPQKNLTETNAEARARGMTYGKLVAMQYLEEQSNARRDKAVR